MSGAKKQKKISLSRVFFFLFKKKTRACETDTLWVCGEFRVFCFCFMSALNMSALKISPVRGSALSPFLSSGEVSVHLLVTAV